MLPLLLLLETVYAVELDLVLKTLGPREFGGKFGFGCCKRLANADLLLLIVVSSSFSSYSSSSVELSLLLESMWNFERFCLFLASDFLTDCWSAENGSLKSVGDLKFLLLSSPLQ